MTFCKQTKCAFLGTNLCPSCDECNSPANIVDVNCTLCWNCEHDAGELRGRINKELLEKVANKEEEVMVR